MEFDVAGEAGRIAAIRRPGDDGTTYFLAHATGFCKEVWEPLAPFWSSELVAWDGRAHGKSSPGEPPYDWRDFGRDVLAVVDSIDADGRVGVGHSMGGAALVLAELERPGTFEGLVLVEPIMFPPPFERFDHPLVESALRRRPSFTSPAEARSNFAAKPAFARWSDEALDAYIRGGLAERGEEWVLRCSPGHEADIYRGGSAHGAYARLGEIVCPVLLVAGSNSNTHPETFVEHLGERFVDAAVQVVDGAGHFLPMEVPDVLAPVVDEFVAGLPGLPSSPIRP